MDKETNQIAKAKDFVENDKPFSEWAKKSINILREDIEKQKQALKQYNGYFHIEIPNERQSAIEYDLEEICTQQGCSVEEVLELNKINIGQLKPGKIITIPIISWKNDEEINTHTEEKPPEKGVDWWTIKDVSPEAKKIADNVHERNSSDTSLIFDKKDARMYILKKWEIVYSTVFLSGKNNTTDTMSFSALTAEFKKETNPDFMITPAGKFPVSLNELSEDYDTSKTSFDFLAWSDATSALHPPTKRSNRIYMEKLTTPQISDNNTTWWCMVMSPEALEIIKKHYQDKKTYAYIIPLHGKLEDFIPISN
jgi:hypothetical protein